METDDDGGEKGSLLVSRRDSFSELTDVIVIMKASSPFKGNERRLTALKKHRLVGYPIDTHLRVVVPF